MREIWCRGKRIDNGEWAYGSPVYIDGYVEMYWFDSEKQEIEHTLVDPETVGQYTGLHDKNGKEIFEGDVCEFQNQTGGRRCWVGKVEYDNQQYIISGPPNKECAWPFELVMSRFIPSMIEVIGNIHDNPELLEVK